MMSYEKLDVDHVAMEFLGVAMEIIKHLTCGKLRSGRSIAPISTKLTTKYRGRGQ